MDPKHCLESYSDQNRQVNEHNLTARSNSDKKESECTSQESIEEKEKLEARVQALRQTITALKAELLEEKALWRKEVELMTSLISASERCLESEVGSDVEADMKSVISVPMSTTDPLVSSPIIRDYEEKLNRYQGALAQAQAEKRFNIRRQIAANTYRKRLNEVEKLCQEELDKVRETATYLEPLKQIASEWGKTKNHFMEPVKSSASEKSRRKSPGNIECGGDFLPSKNITPQDEVDTYEVPVKQIDASLVMDEDASSEIKGKIVLQIGSLPSEVPTICYSAKFE